MNIWIHECLLKAGVAEIEATSSSDAQSVVSRSDSTITSSTTDGFSASRNVTWSWVKAVVVAGSIAGFVGPSSTSRSSALVSRSSSFSVGGSNKNDNDRPASVDRQKSFTATRCVSSALNDNKSNNSNDNNTDKVSLTVRIIDDESIHAGKVVQLSPRHLHIATTAADAPSAILPANSFDNSNPSSLPSDLTQLTHLHEPAVVDCLRRRYELQSGWEMYTSSGPILIAINPCRVVEGLYGERAMRMYWERGERQARGSGRGDENEATAAAPPPHVFGVADAAYRGMMRGLDFVRARMGEEKREDDVSSADVFANQSILVSGESGAGKTVTTRYITQYLAALSKKVDDSHIYHQNDQLPDGSNNNQSSIEQRVLQSNAILESFGNARTLRNDNSSRFGKFIELRFSERGRLMGASIDTYLLEKARIVSHTCGERTYHVFYQVLAKGSLSAADRKNFFIHDTSAEDFAITTAAAAGGKHKHGNSNQSQLCQSGFDDHAKMFGELRTAMNVMGLTRQEQMEIFRAVCGLLHLSNLTLQDAFLDANDGEECYLNKNHSSLGPALNLLGVTYEALNTAVTTVQFKAVDELVKKHLNSAQAVRAVQALIKGAYDSIFSVLVNRVNSSIVGSMEGRHSTAAFIGLLDIFGFESFEKNSFEQLCINYCNESLQQQFNRFVFKLEQQEYKREGINWEFIEFADNQDILDLIDKKHGGILTVLDEQCMLGMRCNDRTFVSAVYDKCKSSSDRFQANTKQKAQGKFSIRHYAGIVEYDTAGFMEKNKDEIPMEASELFANSSCDFIRNLAIIIASKMHGNSNDNNNTFDKPPPQSSSVKRRAFKSSISRVSVGGQFASQLQKLRRRIDETHPHYVRCLKPNDQLRPDRFDPNIVVDQLRCGGILEAIRVSRAGFPQRYTFEHFVARYGVLSSTLSAASRGYQPCRPQRIKLGPLNTPLKRKAPLKYRPDPKKECETLVKLIARWIVTEREKRTRDMVEDEGDEDTLQTDSLSPRSFWKNHQSPPKLQKTPKIVHTPVEVSKVGIQVGATKVFLIQETFDTIERVRGQVLAVNATKIASLIRMFLSRVRYLAMLRAFRRDRKTKTRRRLADEIEMLRSASDTKENDCNRSVNTFVGSYESKSFSHLEKMSSHCSEPQEFQWVSVGHGRFVKRGQSACFDNFQAL